MNRAYQVAVFCAVVPLLVGTSIFLLWLITGWVWLMFAGISTLYAGVVILLVGIVALSRYFWLAVHSVEMSRRRVWLSTLGCTGLLLSNFPVAAAIVVAAFAIQTCYTVVVANASLQPLERVLVFGGGCHADLGIIPPGESVRHRFWIQHDGELQFSAVSGATTYAKQVDDYVTSSMGGRTMITVNQDSTVSIVNKRN